MTRGGMFGDAPLMEIAHRQAAESREHGLCASTRIASEMRPKPGFRPGFNLFNVDGSIFCVMNGVAVYKKVWEGALAPRRHRQLPGSPGCRISQCMLCGAVSCTLKHPSKTDTHTTTP